MLTGGSANSSISEATALLKEKPAAPLLLLHARELVKSFEILRHVILPSHHELTTQLLRYSNRLRSMEGVIQPLLAKQFLLTSMLCKKISVSISNRYRQQAITPVTIVVLDFYVVFEKIRNDESSWLPSMNPTFLRSLNINLQSTSPQEPLPIYAPPPPPSPIGTGSDPNVTLGRSNNTHLNEILFTTYKMILSRPVTFETRFVITPFHNFQIPK